MTGFRKSSRSLNNGTCVEVGFRTSSHCSGGNCVEVGFRSSTHCADNACVEVATTADRVLLRDAAGRQVSYDLAEWAAFVAGVKAGEFDLPA